jgi:pimeloyl-ACP methyl ester carboxylesterase
MAIRHTIEGAEGVALAVREFGNPAGIPLVLIHGWTQSHLCWVKQYESALADEFRIIAPDLRGHGDSAKPVGEAHYTNSRHWADDLAAVINTLGLEQPVLAGWSYGGLVSGLYLRHYGEAALGVGVELLDVVEATLEAAEGHRTDHRLALDGRAHVAEGFAGADSDRHGFEDSEALVPEGLVGRRSLPAVLLHLPVNQVAELLLVVEQHVSDRVIVRKVATEMGDELPRELVEQVRVVVVLHVVESDERPHDVVFETPFLGPVPEPSPHSFPSVKRKAA